MIEIRKSKTFRGCLVSGCRHGEVKVHRLLTKNEGAAGGTIMIVNHKRMRTLKSANVWSVLEISADILAVNSGN